MVADETDEGGESVGAGEPSTDTFTDTVNQPLEEGLEDSLLPFGSERSEEDLFFSLAMGISAMPFSAMRPQDACETPSMPTI